MLDLKQEHIIPMGTANVTQKIALPWPPSANRYWRNVGFKTLVSREAKKYINDVKRLAFTWKIKIMTGRISLEIYAYPPDKRIRDIDNLIKVTQDALVHAGLFVNDSQVDKIVIQRMHVVKEGLLNIFISEIKEDTK